jgi:hypothetical protein
MASEAGQAQVEGLAEDRGAGERRMLFGHGVSLAMRASR